MPFGAFYSLKINKMDKPRYINGKGDNCDIVRIDFTITIGDIILATALLLHYKEKPTKKKIKLKMKDMIRADGEGYSIQGLFSYGIDNGMELEDEAMEIVKNLYPEWIK